MNHQFNTLSSNQDPKPQEKSKIRPSFRKREFYLMGTDIYLIIYKGISSIMEHTHIIYYIAIEIEKPKYEGMILYSCVRFEFKCQQVASGYSHKIKLSSKKVKIYLVHENDLFYLDKKIKIYKRVLGEYLVKLLKHVQRAEVVAT